jgi:hypothetical protein
MGKGVLKLCHGSAILEHFKVEKASLKPAFYVLTLHEKNF